jgi:hypothetical protein
MRSILLPRDTYSESRVSILLSHTKGVDENVSTAPNEEEIEVAAPKIGLTV